MKGAPIVATPVVNRSGMTVRLVSWSGRIWAVARDVVRCLGLGKDAFTERFHANQSKFLGGVEKVQVGNANAHYFLMDELACRLFIEGSRRIPANLMHEFSAWLDAGGMKIEQLPPVPKVETLPVEEVELLPPPRHVPSLRLVPRGPDPMQQLLEREKAYCRDLVKTFLRYCESEEVDKLTGMIDGQIDHLLETRFCPGLNAARYELYRKYWMQGGGV